MIIPVDMTGLSSEKKIFFSIFFLDFCSFAPIPISGSAFFFAKGLKLLKIAIIM